MPNPCSTVDVSAAAAATEEPPPQDGWRGPRRPAVDHLRPGSMDADLATLRAELDRIDNAMHDLLMQRAQVVERVAHSGKPAAFRPGREAAIIRRLVGRHHGALPKVSVFRIWRELLAGTTGMQGGFRLAIHDGDPRGGLTQLAREHFGALTPLGSYDSADQALADVGRGAASVAVLPFPSDASTWWVTLLHHTPGLYVIGRLPFWSSRPEGAPSLQALVVAAAPPDASGDDRSFLGLECAGDISRARLSDELTTAGLAPEMMVLLCEPGSATAYGLAEVDGSLADGDPRLSRLSAGLCRPVVIGGYAVPFTETAS